MSGLTLHTLGARGIDATKPWAVGTSCNGRVKAQAGPGAEAWAETFIRDHAPRSLLPQDWPVSLAGGAVYGSRIAAPSVPLEPGAGPGRRVRP